MNPQNPARLHLPHGSCGVQIIHCPGDLVTLTKLRIWNFTFSILLVSIHHKNYSQFHHLLSHDIVKYHMAYIIVHDCIRHCLGVIFKNEMAGGRLAK